MTIKNVLLIDDDEPTNLIHQRILEKTGLVDNIAVAWDGIEALEYLKKVDSLEDFPHLIFLDINMPRLNGWGFLDEFLKEYSTKHLSAVVVMLTTSLNPDDVVKAEKYGIRKLINKPLTIENAKELIEGFKVKYKL